MNIQVGTEAELRKALTTQTDQLTVEVMSRIRIDRPETITVTASEVSIQSGIAWSELSAPWFFNGKYADESNNNHVISFYGTKLTVGSVALSSYNNRGNFIKCHTPTRLAFDSTRWNDIGSRCFAPRVSNPSTAYDAVYTCPVAMHQAGSPDASLSVRNCVFERCAINAAYWAHIFYVECNDISITTTMLTDCGELAQCQARYIDIRGNTIRNRRTAPLPNGRFAIPDALYLPATGVAVITENVFEMGSDTMPALSVFNGYPDPSRHYIEDNIYRLTLPAPVASKLNVGPITAPDWKATGFDRRSSITIAGAPA